MTSTKQELETKTAALLNEVRHWCESQIELWQQVPNLTLEADGRTGYSDNRDYCYNYGFWRLWERSYIGTYLVCSVDCETGKLVHAAQSYRQGELVLASDNNVVKLLTRLDDVDAGKVISDLEAIIRTPTSSTITSVNPDWPQHQARIRQEKGLSYDKPYRRFDWSK